MASSKKEYRNTRFVLGTVQGGKEYVFTDLPTFKTKAAARTYLRTHPEPGTHVAMWQERDVYKYGVNYGTDRVRVAMGD
jgi:hypothetical protein